MSERTCASCRFFSTENNNRLGQCSRWYFGYYKEYEEVGLNEVIVEDDEGWGAYMGPNFGCVLWEVKAEDATSQAKGTDQ